MDEIGITYLRESLEDRDSKKKSKDFVTTSIKNQEYNARKEAKIDKIPIVKIFKDVNVQSTVAERNAFKEMLDFIVLNKDKKVKVYIKDYYRLGRYIVFFTLRERLIVNGISKENIFFYNEPHSNRINNESDSIIMIKVGAEYSQIEKNRRETMRLHKNKAEEGKPYIQAPFGYKYNKKGEWVIDKSKAEIVKQIFDLTLKGKKKYKEIADMFKISVSMYYKIIKNKNYTGVICHKKKFKNDEGKVLKIENVEYKGNHEPIISLDIFNKVQKKLCS